MRRTSMWVIGGLVSCLPLAVAIADPDAPSPPDAVTPGDSDGSSPATPPAPNPPSAAPVQSAPPASNAAKPAAPTPSADEAPPAKPAPNVKIVDLVNNATFGAPAPKDGVDPAILREEVMLDRLHVSPGVIDGKEGSNLRHAVASFAKMRDIEGKGRDKKVWDTLVEESGKPALVTYTTTPSDVAGPFFPDLPKDYAELAKLKTIGYRSPAQKLGAKFHMGETLLAALNPGVDLGKAGQTIVVADTKPEPFKQKVDSIIVDKGTEQVLGYGRHHELVFAAPATIGSQALPSPSGTYKIKGIAHDPKYYYDPKNFLQGDNHDKLTLPPGPNNPVGSVFMALTKPTYGLHGTPDPSTISKTASHGCVRMTNWDAEELSTLVRRGIVVRFKK